MSRKYGLMTRDLHVTNVVVDQKLWIQHIDVLEVLKAMQQRITSLEEELAKSKQLPLLQTWDQKVEQIKEQEEGEETVTKVEGYDN